MDEFKKTFLKSSKKFLALLWHERLFVALSGLFSWFTLMHLDYVPMWDGWAFTRECFQAAARSGQFRCFGHPAYVPSFLYGLTQSVNDGAVIPIYLINLVLGLVSLGVFRWFVRWSTGKHFTPAETTLLAFVVGLWPTFQAQIIQPGLDYPVAMLFVFMLGALAARRYLLAATLGLAMSFSKETGVVLYGASAGLYLLLLAFDGPRGFSWKRIWQDRFWILALPAIPVLAYVLSFPPQQDAVSWSHVIDTIFTFNISSSFLHYQALSAYVINFAWIFSSMGLAGLVTRPALWMFVPKLRPILPLGVFPVKLVLFVLLDLLALTFFLTRVEFANNPRYVLVLLPLLVFLAAHGLALIPVKLARVGILVTIVVLEMCSMYRTIDPVARTALGTFDFGSHPVLQMSVPENRVLSGRGRDQLMYNGEIFNVHYLMQDVVGRYGLDAVYVADWCMTWIAFDDFRSIDLRTMRRTMRHGPYTRMADIMIREDFKEKYKKRSEFPQELFFLRFPNADICGDLRYYLKYYRVMKKEHFCRDAYCMSVVNLHLK